MESSINIYKVADFYLTVEGMPFEPDNMKPFRVAECCGDPIFSLKIVDRLPQTAGDLIYKTPEISGLPVISLHHAAEGYIFECQPFPGKPTAGKMFADAAFKNASLQLTSTSDLFAFNNAMMLMFNFSTARLGALEMHSSVVMNAGKGYMFLGRSGTGKSTHSSLWIRHIPGTELLNDDNPILRLMPDGAVRVFGSPWSGKTPCYKAKDVPAGAIVSLKQAPYNKIERLSPIQAYATLMSSSSAFRPFKALADGWHDTMEKIAGKVPVFQLECLPDREAAELCHSTVNG